MESRATFMFPVPLLIQGNGVQLREWSDDDMADLTAIYDDHEMDRWTPVASPFDAAAAQVYLAAARALAIAEPLSHLHYAVRYQEFLDGIEPSEWPYHQGDPADAVREAVRCAKDPGAFLAHARRPAEGSAAGL